MSIRMIAVDIGAGSGRVMFGVYDGKILTLQEEARFTHPLERGERGELNWNFPVIWQHVRENIERILEREGTVDSIGVESFSSDYCVFDKDGKLTAPMTSYRGYLGPEHLNEVLKLETMDTFWKLSGNVQANYGFLCQLYHQKDINPALREKGTVVLPLSNAINYLMCGKKCTDVTVSSTTGLADWRTNDWHEEMCRKFLPEPSVLPEIRPCEIVLGDYKLPCKGKPPKVVNVGMHDTAVANHMIGHLAGDQICINAGTWVSVGVITEHPVLDDLALEKKMFNAGMPDGRSLLCRIMMGTWYFQQLKKFWQSQGREMTYPEMSAMAENCTEKAWPIDVWQGDYFDSDPDLPKLIRAWVKERYGEEVQSDAAILRCAYEGVAKAVRTEIENIEKIMGRSYEQIYLGGGAVQDDFFCRLIAERCGKQVVRMPAESTATGNVLVQLKALSVVKTHEEIRSLLENTRTV